MNTEIENIRLAIIGHHLHTGKQARALYLGRETLIRVQADAEEYLSTVRVDGCFRSTFCGVPIYIVDEMEHVGVS